METERKVTMPGEASQGEEHNAGSQGDAGLDANLNQFLPNTDSEEQQSFEPDSFANDLANRVPPEIQSERVAALRNAIAKGTYQVSAEQIAEAVLSEQDLRDESAA